MRSTLHLGCLLGDLGNLGRRPARGLRQTSRTTARAWIPCVVLLIVFFPTLSSAQWAQLGPDLDGAWFGDSFGQTVALSSDGSRVAVGAPNSNFNLPYTGHVGIYEWSGGSWVQMGADLNGDDQGNYFGWSIALSSDGTRVATGAPLNDNNGTHSGHVRVYEWNGAIWIQMGSDIEGEAVEDESGFSVALSSDGSRLAIGAPYNDGNGDGSGHVRVMSWDGVNWVQVGFDLDGEEPGDHSGSSVALSADGRRLAVGANHNSGNGLRSGHVRVFRWSSIPQAWIQVGDDIDGEAAADFFGDSVALSSDGSRVAIGATGNNSETGHARVFSFDGASWVQMGLDLDGEGAGDNAGWSVALSSDGSRLAVGAPGNTGSGVESGHVRVYQWSGIAQLWRQIGPDIDGEAAGDHSGESVWFSSDGLIIAIGAPDNDGNLDDSGQVRIYATGIFFDGFESGGTSAWSSMSP